MAQEYVPPVQSLPAGLLGLLGIKNGGQNPNGLAGFLQPTLDLFTLYMLGQLQRKQETITVPAGAGVITRATTLVVPQGKFWYVQEAQVSVASVGAAPPLDLTAFSIDPQGNVSFVRNLRPVGGIVANGSWTLGLQGMWMRPGDAWGIASNGAGITGFNVGNQLNIAEIQI